MYVLQELAWTAEEADTELHLGHITGILNSWADDLSGGRTEGFDPTKRVRFDMHAKGLWRTMAPPRATWRESFAEALVASAQAEVDRRAARRPHRHAQRGAGRVARPAQGGGAEAADADGRA